MEIAGTISGILAQKGSTVWSIAPAAMVFDAIAMMADKNIGALPVVENDRLIGIISERDYTRKVILKGKSSKETRVEEIMTRDLVTAEPSDTVVDCMRAMTEKRVRHLPVMKELRWSEFSRSVTWSNGSFRPRQRRSITWNSTSLALPSTDTVFQQ
jgi:predicted transcriptional regulator